MVSRRGREGAREEEEEEERRGGERKGESQTDSAKVDRTTVHVYALLRPICLRWPGSKRPERACGRVSGQHLDVIIMP